jgi:hypothetical protein
MRRLYAIVMILLPLAAMAAQADSNSFSMPGPEAQWASLREQTPSDRLADSTSFPKRAGAPPILVARSTADTPSKDVKSPERGSGSDLDLRYVDWDLVKASAKVKSGNGLAVKNGNNANGDKDENGEDEEDAKKGEEEVEKDEAGGGGERQWDAPKLG